MITFTAQYFDGKSAIAHPVEVHFNGAYLQIRGMNSSGINIQIQDFTLAPPLGTSKRFFRMPDGSKCETDDHKAIEQLEYHLGQNKGLRFVHLLESYWKLSLTCMVSLVVFVFLFIQYGVPLIAKSVAFSIPPDILNSLSKKTLNILDEYYLDPSVLTDEEKAVVVEVFETIKTDVNQPYNYTLLFRGGGRLGANAFALPSGTIIITDQMVDLISNNQELSGILRHEMAHIELRHGLRGIIQDAGVFLMISILVGDFASINSVAGSLPTLLIENGYSRSFEYEADSVAGEYLIAKGWGVKPMQDLLTRMTNPELDNAAMAVLSTHPILKNRLNNLTAIQAESREQ